MCLCVLFAFVSAETRTKLKNSSPKKFDIEERKSKIMFINFNGSIHASICSVLLAMCEPPTSFAFSSLRSPSSFPNRPVQMSKHIQSMCKAAMTATNRHTHRHRHKLVNESNRIPSACPAKGRSKRQNSCIGINLPQIHTQSVAV